MSSYSVMFKKEGKLSNIQVFINSLKGLLKIILNNVIRAYFGEHKLVWDNLS